MTLLGHVEFDCRQRYIIQQSAGKTAEYYRVGFFLEVFFMAVKVGSPLAEFR